MADTQQPIPTAKAQLRTDMKARRAGLDAEYRRAASERIAAHGPPLISRIGAANSIIGGFMPIGEEISPLPLMLQLHRQGFRLALPVMAGKGKPLEFRAYAPGDQLKPAVWGIREPGSDTPPAAPDLVLVALLAFDAQGYRLGYGGGYYDRTIHELRGSKTVVTIGLAFDEQRVDAVPHLDYDERLDWMLTPSGACRCMQEPQAHATVVSR